MFKQKTQKSVGYGHKNKKFIGLASTFFGVAAAVFCVLEAFATATIERINYVGSVNKAFDIKAQIGEALVNTALGNDGYSLLFAVGDDEVEIEDLANGGSVENNGVTLTVTGVNTTDGEGLTIIYNLENANDEAKAFKLGVFADTEFAGNTNNDLSRTSTSSIQMLQQDNALENYGAEMTLSFVPNASTTWIGDKDNVAANVYVAGADDTFSGDSALAYSWTGTIDAGAIENYTTVATPNANFTGDVAFYRKGENVAFDTESEVLGTEITIPAVSSYTGYNTCGWNSAVDGSGDEYIAGESFILTDKSIDIFEVCEATPYAIEYNLDGGSAENPTSYTIESDAIALDRATRTGYSFLGWTGTDLLDNTLDVVIPASSTGDREYTANWQINQYTISFDANGGSLIEDITADYNSQVVLPENPTRDNYDFAGWYADEELTEPYDIMTLPNEDEGYIIMPVDGATLYAKWTPVAYNIEYDLDGGTADNPTTYTIESGDIVLERPEYTGYRFLGWTGTDLASYTLDVTIPAGSYGDRAYVANWEHVNYTINFIENGGSTVSNIIKFYGENIESPNDPERLGYDFAGWYSDEELENEYAFSTMPAENITLYAKWTPTVYDISYDFNEGNEVANPETYTIETATFGLNNPTRTGYSFTGWTGTDLDEPSTNVTIAQGSYGNREYTANWQINQYTISFDTNGGTSISDITGDYNSEVSDPAEGPTRTGYTFTGWFIDPECETPYVFSTMPAENITLYAGWEITNYNLTVTTSEHAVATVSENGTQVADLPAESTETVITTYFKTNTIAIAPNYGYYVSALTVNGVDKLAELNDGEFVLTEVLEDKTVEIEDTEYARADYSNFEAALASIPEDLSIYATNYVDALETLVAEYTQDRADYNDRYTFDQDVVDGQTADIEDAIAALKFIGTVTEDEEDANANYGGAIITNTSEDLVHKIGLTDGEEEQRVAEGINVKLSLSVTRLEEDEEDADQILIRELIAEAQDDYPPVEIVDYLDVTLTKQLEGQAPIIVTEIPAPITISAELPELAEAENASREFHVIRTHAGKVSVVDGTVEDNRISFESDLFSTYAIIYIDVPNVPDTGRFTAVDSAAIATFLQFALPIFAFSMLGYGVYLHKRRS